jgi:hypothetical protein
LLLALFAIAFAQDRNISIGGSIFYDRTVIDKFKDYPFEGFGFNSGTSGFIPSSGMAKFGSGVSFNYYTISATDESNVKLTLSGISLGLTPKIRFGQDKIYADVGLEMSIPLSEEMTMEFPEYESETQKNKDTENIFALSLKGRFEMIGLGISKVLTGKNKSIILGASAFISIT